MRFIYLYRERERERGKKRIGKKIDETGKKRRGQYKTSLIFRGGHSLHGSAHPNAHSSPRYAVMIKTPGG